MKVRVITEGCFGGHQRELAWFSRQPKGLYFDVGAFVMGTHTSYHSDGNVFRRSPATGGRPKLQGKYVELDDFRGWYQLGITMIKKETIARNPPLRPRHRKRGGQIVEIPVNAFPSNAINVVTEIVSPDFLQYLEDAEVAPPTGAYTELLDFESFMVVLTVLGHDSNLLIRPRPKGVAISHFNSRFSANAKGFKYSLEGLKFRGDLGANH